MHIQGQAALVTGGSGLGEATARELARMGAKVAVPDMNLANAKSLPSWPSHIVTNEHLNGEVIRRRTSHGPALKARMHKNSYLSGECDVWRLRPGRHRVLPESQSGWMPRR